MIEPTISGMDGVVRAWHVPCTPEMAEAHVREWGYADAGIDQWIINGPYHPVWNWWYMGAVHLRDVEGCPPAKRHYPEAAYEFFIWSLGKEPDIDALKAGRNDGLGFLHPADVIYQFDGITDGQVRGLCEKAAHLICGGMSCDSDVRSSWIAWLQHEISERKGVTDGTHNGSQ